MKKISIGIVKNHDLLYIVGDPSDFFTNEDDHNCDVMGCTSLNHIIAKVPISMELPPVEEVEEIQELVIGKYINDDGHVSKLLYPNNGEITEKVNELIRAFKVNKLQKGV